MKHFLPILMLLWLGTLGLEADDYSVNDAFMFTVQTNLPGASADNQFSIPTYGDSVYNYSVDCDRNGFFDATGVTGDYTCSYPEDNNATPRDFQEYISTTAETRQKYCLLTVGVCSSGAR